MRYYIADQHFFDEDVLFLMDRRPFKDSQEMTEYMIERWNGRIRSGDETVVVGDMFGGKNIDPRAINKVLHRLKGKISLIVGNHDWSWLKKPGIDLDRFVFVENQKEVGDHGRTVLLNHYPILFFGKNHVRDGEGNLSTYMIHGHVHASPEADLLYRFEKEAGEQSFITAKGKKEPMTCNLINAYCGYSDYVPLSLDEWIAIREKGYQRDV